MNEECLIEFFLFQHENLFWTLMVPEWSMQIFMDHFELSRDEAIEVLQDQDKVKIENNSSLDDF